jgi:4-amino-4-deoxy-L-arabinose transferase-like glycosyltransferase
MKNNSKTWLWMTIIAAIALRVFAAAYMGDQVTPHPGTYDQVSYHHLALRVLAGYGFTFDTAWWPITPAGEPTAHWSYLYTGYLVSVYLLFGAHPIIARLIQAVIVGLLHPLLTYLIGRRLAGEPVGLVAAGLSAIYAYFVYYAATLMTESFYITAILAAFYLTLHLREAAGRQRTILAVGLGLALGIAVLLRQLFLLFVPLLLLWWWATDYLRYRQLPLRLTGIVLLLVALLILPFTAHNYARFNQFVLLNTNAGFAFFWANHPIHGTHFEPILPPEMGSYQDLIPPELRDLDEAALDRALLQRGLGFVIEEPGRYMLLSLSRIPAYYMFWPSAASGMLSNVSRVASFGLLWPFMVAGTIIIVARQRRRLLIHPASLLLLFAVVYTAIHLLSWALIRYRLPVDAVLLVFAAIAVTEAARWLQSQWAVSEQRSVFSGD